jgi:adenylate cyclase
VASPNKSALFRLRWLLLAPIPLLWCVLAHLGYLDFVENKVVDWRFHFRGPVNAPAKVAYVDVDSISIQTLGALPWSRGYFATVAKALIERAGVRAVGMDFVFSEEGIPEGFDKDRFIAGNKELGSYLWRTPSVIVAAAYSAAVHRDEHGIITTRQFPYVFAKDLPPLKQIQTPELPSFNVGRTALFKPPGIGLIDTVGGGVRMVPLYAKTSATYYEHVIYYTMGVELARIYYGVERDGVRINEDTLDLVRPDGTTAARIPMVAHQLLEINWLSSWLDVDRNPHASFSEVYAAALLLQSSNENERKAGEFYFTRPEVRNIFDGAVVLIGPVDRLLQDIAPTPMDETAEPRVSVHGNVFKTIVTGRYIRRLPESGAFAVIFALSILVSILAVAGGGRAVFAKAMAVLSAAMYVGLAFELFKISDFVIPVVAPLGAAFSTSFVGLVWQIVEEQKQKGRIKGMFGTYVSPTLVDQMVESGEEPKLGGVVEHITAYFSDIESFSTISEKLSPSGLVELMNEYLTACTDILQAEGGTLDKYIGDAVVMIYGAPVALPGHAHKACVAALRVQARIGELRAKWKGEGSKWPEIVHRLQARIGLNTGPAVVGNMGSTTRFSYTMMSDDVNLAARMESGAKAWGVYTMCTEATRAECESAGPGRVVFRALGRIVVKGRAQPVPIFELVAFSEDVTNATRDCISIFEEGLSKYFARDWDGAIECFRRSEPLEINGPGRTTKAKANPSLIYMAIAEGYRNEPPPPDWDGVYVMKEK